MSAWDDLEVGVQGPELVEGPLTVTDMVRYQGASGDMNPIHHDAEFARVAGYPGPFAVGMRQASVVGAMLAQWLGPASVRRLKVRFREQAWPGDLLTYTAVVRACEEVEGERFVELDLTCRRQTGGEHLVGEATCVVSLSPVPGS